MKNSNLKSTFSWDLLEILTLASRFPQYSALNSMLRGPYLFFPAITASSDMKGRSGITDASVDTLDTLATLATASSQVVTTAKTSSLSPAVSHSAGSIGHNYITIPGVPTPVAVHQGTGQIVNHANLAQALPAGIFGGLQLASPLALNIVPGVQGRVQVGQHVNHVGQLNVPIQVPVQSHSTVPAGGYVTSSTPGIGSPGTTLSIVGGIPAHQVQHKVIGTQVTVAVTSPVSTNVIHQAVPQSSDQPIGTVPVNLPISVLNTIFGGNVSLTNVASTQPNAPIPPDIRPPLPKSPAGEYF